MFTAVPSSSISRLASCQWAVLSIEEQKAWEERANMLNSRPTLAESFIFPFGVTNELFFQSLLKDYLYIQSVFKKSITRKKKSWNHKVRFGQEQVLVGTKILREFHLNYLLSIIFFGINYSKLTKYECVHQTASRAVFHFHSSQRFIQSCPR